MYRLGTDYKRHTGRFNMCFTLYSSDSKKKIFYSELSNRASYPAMYSYTRAFIFLSHSVRMPLETFFVIR